MLNEVKLIGRVGKDPESRHLDSGKTVVSFSIATTERYTDKSGEKKDITQWHNCNAWDKLAEIIEKYVKKGMLIYVSGKIQYREYENKEGVKMRSTDILIYDMKMLESKKESVTTSENKPLPQQSSSELRTISDDGLPF